jgi:hypothetical protein
MILWGLILGKNLITLPGGSTINYQMYLDRGTKEEEEAISDIKMETNPPIMLIG